MLFPFFPFSFLITKRHTIKLIEQPPPVIREHLRVLDALLGPILVPAADMVLGLLEEDELVADALLDEDRAVVLVHDGFLVLFVRT